MPLVEDYGEHCRTHGSSWAGIGVAFGAESAGVAPGTVHEAVGARLRRGASQAAARIAWTPYSRKAMATAEARAGQAALRDESDEVTR
ncbi:hypothetical protein [Streptomyces sp. NPDC049915]|uniref:hypothetical protein n=1 Tax=Streptomyces sp. NPDC049915 TaxID=3155510 RepID=UPI00344192AB